MKKNPALKIIKNLIAEFNGEIKENKKDITDSKKCEEWASVMHLESVNQCLEYVTERMKMMCEEIEAIEK
jgi:hypothetical protein